MNKTFIIAEAGVNHNGSDSLALELIDIAAEAGADAIKFQTFTADNLVLKGTSTAAYQKTHTGMQDQYAMLKMLEMSKDLHYKLFEHCESCGIEFMSTAFDIDAARFLTDLGMKRLKVPSGELTNIPFIYELASLNKPIILSTGMSTLDEVKEAVSVIRKVRETNEYKDKLEDILTVLHCTSNYPTKDEDVNLRAMLTIRDEIGVSIGYSDHTTGVLVPVSAVAMGASVIEKHFTINKDLPGPDHKASLEPNELKLMVQQIRKIDVCLGDGVKAPSPNEYPVRELVRRSIILKNNLSQGEQIKKDDIVIMRPGTGIAPKFIDSIIGMKAKTSLSSGKVLNWEDLLDA